MMELILGILTIVVIVVPIVLGILHVKDYRNIADEYWQEYWEERDDD